MLRVSPRGGEADVGLAALCSEFNSLGAHFTATRLSVWLTTGDQTKLLARQADVSFAASAAASTTITVDDATTYQTIDGFGAALTGSAAYVLHQQIGATQRDALLNDLLTGSGIRLSFLRHSMGASDFLPYGNYTYDDKPSGQTDTGLTAFNLGRDLTDVVPMLKAAVRDRDAVEGWPPPSPCSYGKREFNDIFIRYKERLSASLKAFLYEPV